MAAKSSNPLAPPPSVTSTPSIRPVARRLPASKSIWDDTNLPLAVVITPGADNSKTKPKTQLPYRPKRHLPLSAIPKCLHCGAPHPTRTTHYRPLHHSILLCYLCGKTSSTRFDDQHEARRHDELPILDPNVYDRILVEQPSASKHQTKDATIDFDVPLVFGNHQAENADQTNNPTPWSLPAMSCPPIYWIVLDGTSNAPGYWKTVGTVLTDVMANIPPFVHVGMVSASATTLSSWMLSSPLPHVVHSELSQTDSSSSFCLVPANDIFLPHIFSALRAIADHKGENTHDTDAGMALGGTLGMIANYMSQNATHPGLVGIGPKENTDKEIQKLKYAGGKILCLLNNPPIEVISKEGAPEQPHFGDGGLGGSCASRDLHKSEFFQTNGTSAVYTNGDGDGHDDDDDDVDLTELTPVNLQRFMKPLESEDYFGSIGRMCADAALGVDVVIVSSGLGGGPDLSVYDAYYRSTKITAKKEADKQPFFGVPFLTSLSHRSGAPGPMLFDVQDGDRLMSELLARAPWQSGMVFGAALRMRISPGFAVDDSNDDHADHDGETIHKSLHLSALTSSRGLTGPAVAMDNDAEDDPLWQMGTCDRHTTVTIDMAVNSNIKDHFFVEGFGEVALRPVLQTCFVFTGIEYDDDPESGDPLPWIVRRLRVSSVAMPLSQNVETIYNWTDPEALGVILYQKLAQASVQDGWMAAQDIGNSWLRSLLVCVHQSAAAQVRIREELMDSGVHEEDLPAATLIPAGDRLLNHNSGGSRLSETEIALGFGHEHIRLLSFLVFALLQCDALGPNSTTSLDARAAAMAQMASMPPSVLSRCIAPGLQLWSVSKDCSIRDMIDLSWASVRAAADGSSPNDSVLLLDSPSSIVVCHAKNLASVAVDPTKSIQLGTTLQTSIDLLARSYRSPPTIRFKLEAGTEWSDISQILERVLIEDRPTADELLNYEEWKEDTAEGVINELEKMAKI